MCDQRRTLYAEHKLLIAVFPVYYLKADEPGQKFDDLGTWNTRMAYYEIKRKLLVLQHIENLSDGIGVGQHAALCVL